MALVPSSWKIDLFPTIFICTGQEDNLFFQTLQTVNANGWVNRVKKTDCPVVRDK